MNFSSLLEEDWKSNHMIVYQPKVQISFYF